MSPELAEWKSRIFGMFIHWGLYSIPGGVWKGEEIHGYNEQIRAHAKIPKAEYAALSAQFDPEKWDPLAVAQLAQDSGMESIVITAKHHDGFCLFKTETTRFNVVDSTPYAKDVIGGLAEACTKIGIKFGVYFSTIDWNFEGATGIDYNADGSVKNDNEIPDAHAQLNVNQLTELMTKYGPISEVWFDMGRPTLEQSKLFASTVHKAQPKTMVSGRVFNYQGDFSVMGDNEIPEYGLEQPWQTPASIFDETWGYRSWQDRSDLQGKIDEHIARLVKVVSRGGAYLLNIGPRGDGSIVEFEADVLRGVGNWLQWHNSALQDVRSQPFGTLEFGSATVKEDQMFLFVNHWPEDRVLRLPGLRTQIETVTSENAQVQLEPEKEGLGFTNPPDDPLTVLTLSFAQAPEVWPPTVVVLQDGSIQLDETNSDDFHFKNGAGYYDPPKLYKRSWALSSPAPKEYSIVAQVEGPGSLKIVAGNATTEREFGEGQNEIELGVLDLDEKPIALTLTADPSPGAVKRIVLR